ncbi:MAG TPA: tryptophan synthase subunit alpha [Chloroflexota bacterium]|jgi:tryptophan synthase alpha chain
MSGAIQTAFARARAVGRTAIIPYVTAGFPEREDTPELVAALAAGGAAMVELGVPFSDPTADGTAIQRSGQRALANGVTLADCLRLARASTAQAGIPLLLMGYYNPFLQYGLDRLCNEARQAGVAGLIVPDLPPEEADEIGPLAERCGLDLVFMVAPNSSEERLALIGRRSSGFVYCVTVRGVTGARRTLPADLPEFFQRVRRHTALPIAAGFGISTPDQVREVGRYAEGAVVGSALVTLLEHLPVAERVAAAEQFVRTLSDGAALVTGR